jgi:hypothetical protein
MKKVNKLMVAITLMSVLMLGGTTTRAGILMTDGVKSVEPQPCTETKDDPKVDSGIIVTFTGIIVTFTGIIVTLSDDTTTDCGIIVT